MARIISVITQKGGVGKTTIVNALAATLTKNGQKVLTVDLDPQSNLSFSMGAETENVSTVYDVLKSEISAADCIQHTDTADILPADILLSSIEIEYQGRNREFLLRNALEDIKDMYDCILIDSPPSLGILTVNALAASEYALTPMLPDIFSLQGITKVYETIERVRKTCNPDISIGGIIINKYNRRSRLHKEVYGTAKLISEKFDIPVLSSYIRECIYYTECQSLQCDITNYGRRRTALRDFEKLAKELEERGIL